MAWLEELKWLFSLRKAIRCPVCGHRMKDEGVFEEPFRAHVFMCPNCGHIVQRLDEAVKAKEAQASRT